MDVSSWNNGLSCPPTSLDVSYYADLLTATLKVDSERGASKAGYH